MSGAVRTCKWGFVERPLSDFSCTPWGRRDSDVCLERYVVNGRICLRRLWATTSVAIFRMKGTFACLAKRSPDAAPLWAINKWQNDSTLCPILRMTAAAAAEGRFTQNHASVDKDFFLLTSGGRRWQPARSRFLPAWFPTLAKPAGGRRATRILVSGDGVVEWRPGSETASPVWHSEWGATQLFCQITPLGLQICETVGTPEDVEHPLDVLIRPPWDSRISSTSLLWISCSSSSQQGSTGWRSSDCVEWTRCCCVTLMGDCELWRDGCGQRSAAVGFSVCLVGTKDTSVCQEDIIHTFTTPHHPKHKVGGSIVGGSKVGKTYVCWEERYTVNPQGRWTLCFLVISDQAAFSFVFTVQFTILFCHPVPCVVGWFYFQCFPAIFGACLLTWPVSLTCVSIPISFKPHALFLCPSVFVALAYKVLLGYVGIASCLRSVWLLAGWN